jgi:hypothetical protein
MVKGKRKIAVFDLHCTPNYIYYLKIRPSAIFIPVEEEICHLAIDQLPLCAAGVVLDLKKAGAARQ